MYGCVLPVYHLLFLIEKLFLQENATEHAPPAQAPTPWTPPGTPGREPAGTPTPRRSARPRTPSPPALRGLGRRPPRCDGLSFGGILAVLSLPIWSACPPEQNIFRVCNNVCQLCLIPGTMHTLAYSSFIELPLQCYVYLHNIYVCMVGMYFIEGRAGVEAACFSMQPVKRLHF